MKQQVAATNVISLPRKASKQVRRQQIIDATIDTLAKRGIAQATLSEVAAIAGVSHGLVIFHFQSKENLLAETLHFLSEEYRLNWKQALDSAPTNAAHQLDALIRADLNPDICDQRKLIAWCAFWGEAQSRPFYQERNGVNDEAYITMLEEICARIIADGGYALDPVLSARVIRVTGEGVWLDWLSMNAPYSRAEGLKTIYFSVSALFTKHFNQDGLLDSPILIA